MRTLFDPQEALIRAHDALKTPQRFQAWLSTDPDRLFRAYRTVGIGALERFLSASGVPGVFQHGEQIYVGLTPLQLPAWVKELALPEHRSFLARYVLWRLETAPPTDAALSQAGSDTVGRSS